MKRYEYLALIAVIFVTLYVAANSDRDAAPSAAHQQRPILVEDSAGGLRGAPRWAKPDADVRNGPSPAVAAPVAVHSPAGPLPDTSTLIAGTASWFCGGSSRCTRNFPAGGPYAAAGSELRVPGWRGKWVSVCSGGRCTRARLIDWCFCGGSRVIDLYKNVFQDLSPDQTEKGRDRFVLRGVIPVMVTFVDPPHLRLPATDTGGTP